MIKLPEECLRGDARVCRPLAQLQSDDGESFICFGENGCRPDPFTFCWHNSEIDERSDWDRRDVADTISVLAQGLSVKANEDHNADD